MEFEMSEVLITKHGCFLDIRLNTPDNGNLISNAMAKTIVEALEHVPLDTKLIRMTGAGADFCRGRVSPMPPKGTRATAFELRRLVAEPALALYSAFRATSVPVLTVVSGRTFGVGLAIAVASDLTIATDDAIFQVPEMTHDIPPLLVMTAMLPKLPLKAIAHLALTSEAITASQGREWGIVSKIVPPSALAATTEETSSRFQGYSVTSVQAIKEHLRSGKEMTYQGSTLFAANLSATSHSARFVD
jgi:enoyl-CoA hydratase/carnithine racemase